MLSHRRRCGFGQRRDPHQLWRAERRRRAVALQRTQTAAGAAQALYMGAGGGLFLEICGDIMLALPEYTNAEFDRTLALRNGGCTHIFGLSIKR